MTVILTPRPVPGDAIKAFHPAMLGVVKHGTVVTVGYRYVWIDFGPMLGGTWRVPKRDVVSSG